MVSRLWDVFCRAMLLLAVALLLAALVLFGVRFPGLVLLVIGIGWWRGRRWSGTGSAFGTARIATLEELRRAGLLASSGLVLGHVGGWQRPTRKRAVQALLSPFLPSASACRIALAAFLNGKWAKGSVLRIHNFTHLATFAPTGRGKGVSVLTPNLLSFRSSCVITDPKGELFGLTAKWRAALGHKVYRFDPFQIASAEPGASLNPLDFIDPYASDFLDACRDLANSLIVRTGEEKEPHWSDSAEIVLTAFIAYVCAVAFASERNLVTVRHLLTSRHRFNDTMVAMQKIHDDYGGVLAALGHQLTWYVDRELGSVLSTVNRFTNFLDGPAVAKCIEKSSFDPRELRNGKTSVYLVLPPERLVTLAPLMRCWLSTTLRVLTRGKPSEANPVVFFLDEAAALGRMQILEDATTLMRGYGIRLWYFFQSVGQLQTCFGPKAGVILENIDTQQYFGVNSFETADAISKRMGEASITISSLNESRSRSRPEGFTGQQTGQTSTSWSLNFSELGRRLFTASEILTASEDAMLVFHRNLPVIVGRRLRYFDREFQRSGFGTKNGLGLAEGVAAAGILLVCGMLALTSLILPVPVAPRAVNRQAGFPALPRHRVAPAFRPPPLPMPWPEFPVEGMPFGGPGFEGDFP